MVEAIIALYRARRRFVIGVSAVIQGPAFLITAILGVDMLRRLYALFPTEWFEPGAPPPTSLPVIAAADLDPILRLGATITLVAVVASTLTAAALAVGIGELRGGRGPTLLRVLATTARRLLALTWTLALSSGVMVGIVVVGLYVMGLLLSTGPSPAAGGPGAFLALVALVGSLAILTFVAARWGLWVQAAMLEGRAGRGALRRSWRLVAGSTGRVIGYALFFGGATAVLSALLGQAVDILADATVGTTGTVGTVVRVALQGTVAILLAPIVPAAMTFLYLDLRLRGGEPITEG